MADDTSRLDAAVRKLQSHGVTLPRNAARKKLDALEYTSMSKAARGASPNAETLKQIEQNNELMMKMGRSRSLSKRFGSTTTGGGMGGDVWAAIPRFYDPMEYWDLSGLPWNMADEGHRHKIHKWFRLFYMTHYLVPILIDIFTRFPLVGMNLYCLGGETEVITWEGKRKIRELAGTTQKILDGNGHWQKAPIQSFGTQKLWRIELTRNNRTKAIFATDNHRWFVEGGRDKRRVHHNTKLTIELSPGDKLHTVYATNRAVRMTPSSIGVAHGIVFGDGAKSTGQNGGTYVDLWGQKNIDLLRYFPSPVLREYNVPRVNVPGVRVDCLPRSFKDLPSLDESSAYLFGWLAGYFAADGTVSKKGEAILYSTSRQNLEFVQTICHRLGIKSAAPYISEQKTHFSKHHVMYMLPLDLRSLPGRFFVVEEHRDRHKKYLEGCPRPRRETWTVQSVSCTDREEEVYCATVDSTSSFVLADNLLTGNCKDEKLATFYEELFFDKLDYANFFVNLGREFWTIGEAFPLGSFDEDLGVWEHEELLNPEDIVIKNFPLLQSKQMLVQPPDYLKKLAKEKNPAKEYRMLELGFPELIPYLRANERIPISGVLLKQVANTLNPWDDHGTPILLRGLRTLMHEEKLLASQDAIAERLYSPLILAKLGIMDLGDNQGPWIPGPDELEAVRDDLDIALSSDFRLMVHHFGLDIINVFGREQMPRLGDDFDRIERRLMQIFGVNPSLLSAGSSSQPYASSALQAEFLNQILRTYQDYLKAHFRERALVVAEAQEHYDYVKHGDKRVPIMEEVVVYDEDGNKSIEERPKLLVPDLQFETLDLRDEATERQFLQTLRAMGVPISDDRLMVGVNFDVEDEEDDYNESLVRKTVKQQEAKRQTYDILKTKGLPIPPDLQGEVEGVMQQGPPGGGALPGGGGGAGGAGAGMGGGLPGGGPAESVVMPGPPPGLGPTAQPPVPGGGPPPAGATPQTGRPGGNYMPAVSVERRPGMPTASTNGSDSKESKTKEDDTVPEKIVEKLPRNKKEAKERKKYSILEDDVPPLKEEDESQSDQSAGSAPDEGREASSDGS